jgi:8-oxo-dGTP diphosphatase
MDKKHPKVGVGVMITRDEKVLMGLRKGSHGEGEWSFPGGSVEWGESLFQTVIREAMEESGLVVSDLELISVADEMRYIDSDGKQFLVLGFKANASSGEPKVMEPEKCERWDWFSLDSLPENIFEGTRLTIENYKNKNIYLECRYENNKN